MPNKQHTVLLFVQMQVQGSSPHTALYINGNVSGKSLLHWWRNFVQPVL